MMVQRELRLSVLHGPPLPARALALCSREILVLRQCPLKQFRNRISLASFFFLFVFLKSTAPSLFIVV